jgi:hydroxymethylglutaryl-CoA reductase
MSSLPRLAILSGAAIGGGLLLGTQYAWLVILGVAGAQVVLVAVAARSLLNR